MTNHTHKRPIIEKIFVPIVKGVSNFFWDVIDTWSYKSKKMAAFYNKYIGCEYKSEYETFGLSKGSKVLHIGCGPYPLTMVELATMLDIQIVGIDVNGKAVRQARDLINKRSLENKITIEQADGATYPVESFDVIIVSSCSSPKIKILHHLFATAKTNAIIIVRELDVATREIYECITEHKNIVIVKKMHHHALPIILPIAWDALYLKKT